MRLSFGLAAWLVPGFTVASLGSAVFGSIVVALVSSVFAWAHPRVVGRAAAATAPAEVGGGRRRGHTTAAGVVARDGRRRGALPRPAIALRMRASFPRDRECLVFVRTCAARS